MSSSLRTGTRVTPIAQTTVRALSASRIWSDTSTGTRNPPAEPVASASAFADSSTSLVNGRRPRSDGRALATAARLAAAWLLGVDLTGEDTVVATTGGRERRTTVSYEWRAGDGSGAG